MHKTFSVPVVFCTSCISTADKCSNPIPQYRHGKFCSAECVQRELLFINLLFKFMTKKEVKDILQDNNIPIPSILECFNG